MEKDRIFGISAIKRLLPYLVADTPALSTGERLRSVVTAFLALLAIGWTSSIFLHGSGLQMMITSMGASAVLLFVLPHSPLTQPWPLVGGHLISASVGVCCALWIPDLWLAAALSVALSILAMHITRSMHPPGGAVALLPVLGGDAVLSDGFGFVLAPVGLNVLVILGMGLILNNIFAGRHYPSRPISSRDPLHRHNDPTPLERLGINKSDLRQALREMDVLLDVSEEDLRQVYNLAGMTAYRRKMGELTCGDIMSRDLVAAEFATDLEEAWAQLRFHKVKAIPVTDRAQRVIGIVTLVDFLKRADLKTYETFQDKLVKFIRRTPGSSSEKPEVVGQIMATPVDTVYEDAHVLELVPLLSDRGLHHIPVVNQERRLVGMVTQSDLIAALYRSCKKTG